MKTILIFALAAFLVESSLAHAADMDAGIGDLNQYFQNTKTESQSFIFTRKMNGPRMSLTIGTQYGALSEPGATFTVPFGSSFRLFEKHSGINFDALTGAMEGKGFLITKYSDTRSLGGELQRKRAVVLIEDNQGAAKIKVLPFSGSEARKVLGADN